MVCTPANAATIHHYRFESDLGFLVDSAGNGDLTATTVAPEPIQLPATGRGAGFPKGFDLVSPAPNASGADFVQLGLLTSTIGTLPDGFTIEAFVRFDSISDAFGKIITADSSGPGQTRWNFQVRTDSYNGTAPRELIVDLVEGSSVETVGSDFIVEPDTDYYLAASVAPTVEVVFYVQDLSAGTPLQVITRALTGSTPSTSSGVFAVGGIPVLSSSFRIDGLLDEVRLSDTVLDQDDLLISKVNMDVDEDGVENRADNCVFVANADQRDSNSDGFGNLCDADLNGDCITNAIDLGQLRTVFFTGDADADFNGDGVVNAIDLGLLKENFFAPPGSSGVPNFCDAS